MIVAASHHFTHSTVTYQAGTSRQHPAETPHSLQRQHTSCFLFASMDSDNKMADPNAASTAHAQKSSTCSLV